MKRDYKTGVKGITTEPILFTGTEVEHTPAHGHKTLFVVGILADATEIVEYARGYECSHVYLGANHSFVGDDKYHYSVMIKKIIKEPMWCTLEMTNDVYKECNGWLNKFAKESYFIPNIRVELPNIMKMNYNTTIKMGDVDYKATNPGVWCYKLNDLQKSNYFTSWNEYGQDQIIDEVNK